MAYDYSGALQAAEYNKKNYGLDYSLVANPGLRGWDADQVPVYDGQLFTLLQDGKTVYQGTGAEGLAKAAQLSKDLNGNWQLNGSQPENTVDWNEDWFRKHPNDSKANYAQTSGVTYASHNTKDLAGALKVVGPLLAAGLGGALLLPGAAAAGGAGAAGSIGASSLGGTLAASAAGLGPAVAAGGIGALGAALPAFDGITVVGAPAAGLSGAGLAGAGALGGLAVSNLGAATAGAQPGPVDYGAQVYDPADITVVGAPNSLGGQLAVGAAGLGAGAAGAAGAGAAPDAVDPNTITVTGQQPPLDIIGPLGDPLAVTGATAALASGAGSVTAPPEKSTLDKIVDYLRLAGLGTGLLGGLLGGGGGSGKAGKIPGGIGGLNPIFSGSLPTNPNIPGVGTAANLGVRTMPAQDWTRYGMRPEQSFFNYVPSNYTPPAPGQQDNWDRMLAVRGM